MAVSKVSGKVTIWMTSDSTGQQTKVTGPWMLAHGLGTGQFRVLSEIRALIGNYQQAMGYQTAAVATHFPDGWTFSATNRTTNGVFVEDFPASSFSGKLWIRAGLAVSSSSTGLGEAQVSLQSMATNAAGIVGSKTFDLNPDINAGATAYYPITEPFPALSLSEVMVACILSGVNGTVTYQPAVRFFNRSDEMPSVWSDLAAPQSPNTNERRNFGGQAVTPGSNLWAQAGLKITTAARATVRALTSARY